MANPNNLIRPPVLNVQEQNLNVQPPPQGQPQQANNVIANEALDRLVTGIINRVLRNEGRQIIQSIINPNSDQFIGADQPILPQFRENLSELDKIPDVVRCLKDFTGQPGEFNSWKKSVDRILKLYDNIKGTPKYFGILSVIRNKIVGQADIVLESYNTPLDWKCIARCLTMHYADKRDISTLEYQMTSLVQGNLTIQEFYHSVYSHLSLILDKIGCMEINNESLTLLTQTYRDKALDTFVRGLKGDLPRLLGIREPSDLPQALHLYLKLENQNYRTQYAISHYKQPRQITPPHPPRRNVPNHNRNDIQRGRPTFYPQLAHLPQPRIDSNHQNIYRQFPSNQNHYHGQHNLPTPLRPAAPKPQPKPEPMDVDQTIQTRRINYMNRPAQNQMFGKRPPPGPPAINKHQRNYHIEPQEINFTSYEQTRDAEDEKYEQSLAEYSEHYEETAGVQQEITEFTDFTDIHFLD